MITASNDVAEVGRRVLHIEAKALSTMAENMPKDFVSVVDLILATTGRVIISGIGKSGHIGRKISAHSLAPARLAILCMQPKQAMAIWG